MKKIFKYLGLLTILLVSFYYTEKMSKIVINNDSLVKEINNSKNNYNILPVSAIIEDNYIIPGLNGYAVNVLKSYDNMRFLDSFNSYYLEYDIIKPKVSLDNNKDKIIKYGNSLKNNVAIIIKDNNDIINYSLEKNIKLTRMITKETFDSNSYFEQINGDYEDYNRVEKMLNNNINKNICYADKTIIDICRKNNKYLVEASIILNKHNLSDIKNKVRSGYIIYVNDDVKLVDFKILVRQIYYQDLNVVYLSDLIGEERIDFK